MVSDSRGIPVISPRASSGACYCCTGTKISWAWPGPWCSTARNNFESGIEKIISHIAFGVAVGVQQIVSSSCVTLTATGLPVARISTTLSVEHIMTSSRVPSPVDIDKTLVRARRDVDPRLGLPDEPDIHVVGRRDVQGEVKQRTALVAGVPSTTLKSPGSR